jgi:hypothetical protein
VPDHTFSLLDLELGSNGPSVFLPEPRLWSDPLSLVPACAAGKILITCCMIVSLRY